MTDNNKPSKGGRPTKMTPETIQKLEQAFLMGCTDLEACLYADIAPSTLYAYQNEDTAFSERKAALKTNPVMKARSVVLEALKNGDLLTAHKVIDRVEGTRVKLEAQIDGKVDLSLLSEEELDRKIEGLLRAAG